MNAKRTLLQSLAGICILSITLYACKKDNSENKTPDLESSQNNSLAESDYNDVTTLVDIAAYNGTSMTFRENGMNEPLSGCATVTIDTVSTPRVITIDFGDDNCLCIDGRNRRGVITATYTGKYKDQGTVISISFTNYFVNDNQIKGTKTVTNMGLNNAGHPVYSISVSGTIVKANNGGTITWNSTREREWIAGSSTPLNLLDDTYGITGTANGTNADGSSYTMSITQQLIRKMTCRWFESGKIQLTPEGEPARTLDYGNTGCDANATVTVANRTFNIVLP